MLLSRTIGNEIHCFDFAEWWKGERKSLFSRHSSLKTRKNSPHFVPSDEKAKSHSNFYLFGAMGKNSQPGEHVIIDRGYSISKRDGKASTGQNQKEIEANQFAATLLMPSKLIREKVKEVGGLPLHDYQVEKLAKIFNVSEQAMMHRLSNLGLL